VKKIIIMVALLIVITSAVLLLTAPGSRNRRKTSMLHALREDIDYSDFTIDYPADTSGYDHVTIRRLKGDTPPNADCNSDGTLTDTLAITDPTNLTDSISNGSGMFFSYRLCIYGPGSTLISSTTALPVKAKGHVIFMTSGFFRGNLGGIAGANAICNSYARSSSDLRGGNSKAMLCTTGIDISSNIIGDGGVYSMYEYTQSVDSVAKLWTADSQDLVMEFNYDEQSSVVNDTSVWVGCDSSGIAVGNNCLDWTSNDGGPYGEVGNPASVNGDWLIVTSEDCTTLNPIYCISQQPD